MLLFIFAVPSSPTTPDGTKVLSPRQPTNLLGTFLTFSSIVLQNIKGMLLKLSHFRERDVYSFA